MNYFTRILFAHFDQAIARSTGQLRNRVFSRYRDMPWTDEQYRALAPIIRAELEDFVTALLGTFDNWGAVLEGDVGSYSIQAHPLDVTPDNWLISLDPVDISDGEFPYRELWLAFLEERRSAGLH